MRIILHIDFNSYFATVEQQANPRLRGKPIGVTGGDRMKRTVIGAASVEAKRFGVKTGMQLWEARKLCPELILVPGDSDKYLEVTKRFLAILKDYSPHLEVFSIDEVFLEIPPGKFEARNPKFETNNNFQITNDKNILNLCHSNFEFVSIFDIRISDLYANAVNTTKEIKYRIHNHIGEWITCSIGISYNKLMAKLAGSLQKPDGLVVIPDQKNAIEILDKVELDAVCGIGPRIKKRLFNMGITNFRKLRAVPLEPLLASFKSYGQTLYNMARGIDESPIVPFYEKEEVKSVGHRHTIDHDTNDPTEVKQILLKLTELIARKLRAKKLVGKTITCWFRYALNPRGSNVFNPGGWKGGWKVFSGDGMQVTIPYTDDGWEIFKAAWKSFQTMWSGAKIRMIGASVSNLRLKSPHNLSFLADVNRKEVINKTLDEVNQKYGEFTLQRGILLQTPPIRRLPNPFLADRRFK